MPNVLPRGQGFGAHKLCPWPGAREPWRQRRRGSPNFLSCGAMLTKHLDHKLAAHKAISGWPFLSQLLSFKQLKQTEVLTENSGVIRVTFAGLLMRATVSL